ncbi:MmgE/PrpD family protein, putative [Rhodococcus wratislaviensis]|uniref:MmgE/PrpD family protein, putative n=1 Tax=Rhodococcus wratislaviensis TaxID=44752 RepID=A0A402CEW8_RHOWR|nr:MmgE/PrpD family protein [Rhodococcus wratislaviensis]GCE42150.1 MmgE/PrpD family protein, putative [Rhodococcus wratislaviensis]
MTIARDFVEWAWTLDQSTIPTGILDRTALHILDGLGTALAASRMNAAPFAVPTAASMGHADESSVIGSCRRFGAAGAALANGILIHSLDFDDTHPAGLVHATAVTLPAALAVAEREYASGADLLRAVLVGDELLGRISSAAPHGFHARGFHASSVCGVFASSLIASLLSGSSKDQAVNALGIAASQASGSMEFLATGVSTKQIHPGWASMAGVMSSALAVHGGSGPDTVFEGERGLYRLFSAVPADLAGITAGLGDSWQIADIEVKPYPACHLMHRNLDIAAQLHARLNPAEIDFVVVGVPPESIPIVAEPSHTKVAPRSAYEAKFSVQWSVAAMLLDGHIDVDSYRSDRISRPDIVELSSRVRINPVAGDGPAALQPGDVTIGLADGTLVRLRSDDPGSAETALSMHDMVIAKFRANVGAPEETTDALVSAVMGLTQASDLRALRAALTDVAEHWELVPVPPVTEYQS